ncbi:hypothetical protein FGIG_02114 [Fasciola gigantica]|uniref:Uncharacterized protein n=1 Tax=Fasciola gigantica TaxID=46835 RepID=A0A504Z6K6_FASGI|nr:hypothetical protein FGIG_02114 [Fasciola gigantica]
MQTGLIHKKPSLVKSNGRPLKYGETFKFLKTMFGIVAALGLTIAVSMLSMIPDAEYNLAANAVKRFENSVFDYFHKDAVGVKLAHGVSLFKEAGVIAFKRRLERAKTQKDTASMILSFLNPFT